MAPFAALAIWGISFLLDCLRTLEAPGVPIEYTYRSNSGELTIRAQSYLIAAQQGTILIQRPVVLTSSGTVIASLESLQATGLKLLRGADQVYSVHGRNLVGRLTRLPNGRFDLEDYLPSHHGGAKPVPYDVEIQNCRIDFVDLSNNSRWSRVLSSPKVSVEGLGRNWIASATVAIDGVGISRTRVQNIDGEYLSISGSTAGAQLAALLGHFSRTPDFKSIRALANASCDSLEADGSFRVLIAKGTSPVVEARLAANATGARYGRFFAASASFVGTVGNDGVSGRLHVANAGCAALFSGKAAWKGASTADGELTVDATGSQYLPEWARKFVPNGAAFSDGKFHGWLALQPGNRYHISGDAFAGAANFGKDRLTDLGFGLDAESERLVIEIDKARFERNPIVGTLTIDLQTKSINGIVSAPDIDLNSIASKFGLYPIEGKATGAAVIAGTLQSPRIAFDATGSGAMTLPHDHTVSLGEFSVSGAYDSSSLRFDQVTFDTAYGLAVANGAIAKSGALNLNVVGRGIRFAEYDPDLSGTANLAGVLRGTLTQPLATGRLEASNVSYKQKSIEAIVTDFTVDHRKAEFLNIEGARGTAGISGQAQVQFGTGALAGQLSIHDVQLSDWFGDSFVGAVDVPSVAISGSLSHPVVTGNLQGRQIVAKDVRLDDVSAAVGLDGETLSLTGLTVRGAGGTVTGSAQYSLDTRSGKAVLNLNGVQVQQLSVDELIPSLDPSVAISGTVDATAGVTVANGNLIDVSAAGNVSGAAINQTELGAGAWHTVWHNNILSGSIALSAPARSFVFNDVQFDPDAKRLKGELNIVNFPVDRIVQSALPYFSSLPPLAQTNLMELKGSLTLSASIDGTLADPGFSASNLQLVGLASGRNALGDLKGVASLNNHKWTIDSLSLTNGPADIALHGTIDEVGDTHIDATEDNRLDLSQLSQFDPSLSRLTGTAHLWVSADGPTSRPRIVASVTANDLFAPPGVPLPDPADDRYLRFELDNLIIDPGSKSSPGMTLSGAYFYKGFRGAIAASAPFEYPFHIPDSPAVDGLVTVENTDLRKVADMFVGLDPKRTIGNLKGAVKIHGPIDALAATGTLNLDATSVAMAGVDNYLKNVSASGSFGSDHLHLEGHGTPSGGGSLSFNATVPVSDLGRLASQIQQGDTDSLLDRPLQGSVVLTSAPFKQKMYAQSTVAGTASSNIQINGTLRHPNLKGTVAVASGDIVFNGFPTATPQTREPIIDPTFDVALTVAEHARLRSATTDLYMSGTGSLKGSLHDPKLDVGIIVEKGSLRLPAAVLRLEPGGTVTFNYGIQAPTTASALVDLEGNTSITASRYGDLDIERYDITLGMKGDLLQENGLNLTATSEPPDLTQDKILGILGETDYLETLSSEGRQNSVIQAALLSTVPTLLDPWTSQLAQGLGLDYVNLEYNALEMASVTVGKTLGYGLTIEGNRQITEPPPGFASQYDLRILYRPRQLSGVFQQFRFFFGADQDNPWKVGFEYGVRF